jgi:hypothetical protein
LRTDTIANQKSPGTKSSPFGANRAQRALTSSSCTPSFGVVATVVVAPSLRAWRQQRLVSVPPESHLPPWYIHSAARPC